MNEVKAVTAMLVSRTENWINEIVHDGGCTTVHVSIQTMQTLLTTIRELESEVKKKHHGRPSYADIGKPRYYCAE